MDMYNYRRRLSNENSMEAMKSNTIEFVENTFREAPNFKEVFLNGYKKDARIDSEIRGKVSKDSNHLSLLFRPSTKVFKGDIVEFDTTHWLVTDVVENPIYPSATVEFCNEWLRWIDENEEYKTYPAVVLNEKFDLNEDKYIISADNTISIRVSYNNNTKKIKNLQRFIFNDLAYEIHGIDALSNVNLGKGYIELKGEQTFTEVNDNLDNDIADNEGSNWGAW